MKKCDDEKLVAYTMSQYSSKTNNKVNIYRIKFIW